MKTVAGGAKISYKDHDLYTLVYLDGKRVGRILQFPGKGFAYVPNSGTRGEFFPSRAAVKTSLEGR